MNLSRENWAPSAKGRCVIRCVIRIPCLPCESVGQLDATCSEEICWGFSKESEATMASNEFEGQKYWKGHIRESLFFRIHKMGS